MFHNQSSYRLILTGMARVCLGTSGISLDVDRGLTSGKNTQSSQFFYKFINLSRKRRVMKPVKSSMKIVNQSKERKSYPNGLIFQTTCFMFPSDFKLKREARSLKGTGMVDLIRLKLGNGDSFLFWEDKWFACGVIKELFPRLYALELHKHATVRMKLMAPSLDNSFRRRVRSGAEESQFNSLLEIVQVINLVPYEDRYFWSLESKGDYSVASIRKLIDEKRFQEVVCKGGVETTSHLFFQCVLSKQIMRKVSSWWNDDYTDVSSYEEWRLWLVSIRILNKLKSMMEGVFYGLWWSI
nr:RNA-directed DNA polymerase, eukaryota [Tanacetum cinerariifolium]